MEADFSVINMPQELSRSVKRKDALGNWVKDQNWYDRVKIIYSSLFKFLIENDLIESERLLNSKHLSIEDLIVKFSDLTEIGQALVMSGSVDRWLGSFDRPGSKKALGDVRYLERELAKVR